MTKTTEPAIADDRLAKRSAIRNGTFGAGAVGRPPDHPGVPRSKLSGRAIALAVFGALVVGGYAATAYTDYDPALQRDEIPASVRSSPGGYRSFHFWHSGYHGGK